jgi:hypothetical protein
MNGSKLPFVKIEQAVIGSKGLTATDKLLYAVLKSFRNRGSGLCCPSLFDAHEN